MKPYTRVRLAEREEISCELAAGSRLRVMDRQLGRAPSTIGRELRRAERTRSTYRATRGQHVARRSAQRPRKLLTYPNLRLEKIAFLTRLIQARRDTHFPMHRSRIVQAPMYPRAYSSNFDLFAA